jgi:hypothetical protein
MKIIIKQLKLAGVVAAGLGSGMFLGASPALAAGSTGTATVEHHGAIAHSDAKDHWGHAFVNNKPTEKEAAADAVANCQVNVGSGNNCKVVLHWHNGCGAFAESGDMKHHGVGESGSGKTADEIKKNAEKKAVDACVGSGATDCKVRDSGCTEGLVLK